MAESTAPVTPSQALALLPHVLKTKRVPMLHGSPGISKSAIAKQLADMFNLELIDIRLSSLEPTDLNGFPTKTDAGKASYIPFDIFPIKGDAIPAGKNGWLIILDEINSAALSIQKAAYKLTLDRMVGNKPLHDNAFCMSAGNLTSDGAIVNKMSTALQSRMIHFEVIPSAKDWTAWAETADVDHRVLAFIRWKAEDALMIFDPKHDDYTFACPRTWEMLSDVIKPIQKLTFEHIPLLIGTVGNGAGREFLAYSEIFHTVASYDDMVNNPDKAEIPDESSALFAVTGIFAKQVTKDTISQSIRYLKRLPLEFQTMAMQQTMSKDPTFIGELAVKDWLSQSAAGLI